MILAKPYFSAMKRLIGRWRRLTLKRITIEIPEKVARVISLTLIGGTGATVNVTTSCTDIVGHDGDTWVVTGDDTPDYWKESEKNG